MRKISVTYRAAFQQPVNALRLKAIFHVEVFEEGKGRWRARSADTGVLFCDLGCLSSAEAMQASVVAGFEHMNSEWEIWAKPHLESDKRQIDPLEIALQRDGTYLHMEPNDYTHVFDPLSPIDPTADIDKNHMAACGSQVRIRNFVSTKQKVPPSCRACAVIFAERYA